MDKGEAIYLSSYLSQSAQDVLILSLNWKWNLSSQIMYSCFPLLVVYTLFYIKQSNNYLYEKKKKERKKKNHFVVIKMPSEVLYKWRVHLIFTHLYMEIKFCDIFRPSNELYLKKI